VEVSDGQDPLEPLGDPSLLRETPTLGAVPIAARVVCGLRVAARRAHVEVSAERGRATESDRAERALLIEGQRASVLERTAMRADDIGDLEARAIACGALVVRRHGVALPEERGLRRAQEVERALGMLHERARDLR